MNKKVLAATKRAYSDSLKPNHLRMLPNGSKVTLAREGSVCAYVTLPKGKTLTEKTAYAKMMADEYHIQENGSIRLWWD